MKFVHVTFLIGLFHQIPSGGFHLAIEGSLKNWISRWKKVYEYNVAPTEEQRITSASAWRGGGNFTQVWNKENSEKIPSTLCSVNNCIHVDMWCIALSAWQSSGINVVIKIRTWIKSNQNFAYNATGIYQCWLSLRDVKPFLPSASGPWQILKVEIYQFE